MRGIAYVIAAVAAIGIMIGIAMIPDPQTSEVAAPLESASTASTPANVMSEPGTLTLSVPSMHCEFSCYPRIKETLEGAEGIQEVELAAQKEEGVLDNRQVVVKYDAGFDVNAALTLLAQEGFDDSDVVQ